MKDLSGEIKVLLSRAASGNEAVESVLPLVYAELRTLAVQHLRKERAGHTLQATDLVHEAYLRLAGNPDLKLMDRNHVFATAAVAMRHVLIDHARKKRAGKRIGPEALVPLQDTDPHPGQPMEERDVDLLALDQALDALARVDPRGAQMVELRYFGGFTEEETAQILGVSKSTVAREWRAARLWLRREMKRGASGDG
jgi:RNA polymerase sigma factor (TIGR02999 family)